MTLEGNLSSSAIFCNTIVGLVARKGSGGVSNVSPVGASVANAVMEKSVREMQSTERTTLAYIELVHDITFDPGSAISTWTVEIVGHVVSRSQSSVSSILGVRTACESRKRRNCRKALVQFNELVILVMIEKPKKRVRFRIVLASCWVLWTDLTKASLLYD